MMLRSVTPKPGGEGGALSSGVVFTAHVAAGWIITVQGCLVTS